MSLSVLIRKLFENLIINILRKKYGTQGLPKYYDTSKRRFHDFSILLKSLESNISDFHSASPYLVTCVSTKRLHKNIKLNYYG
jgi:hypothetical protein